MKRFADVVVAVLIVALALVSRLPPSVESGRRPCAYQLYQQFKANRFFRRGYGDNYGKLPAAALPNPDLRPEQRLSWIINMVPYAEANNLYSRMDNDKGLGG